MSPLLLEFEKSFRFDAGDICAISGWGDTDAEESGIQMPHSLMTENVNLVDFKQCENSYYAHRKYLKEELHICAAAPGVDTCQVTKSLKNSLSVFPGRFWRTAGMLQGYKLHRLGLRIRWRSWLPDRRG